MLQTRVGIAMGSCFRVDHAIMNIVLLERWVNWCVFLKQVVVQKNDRVSLVLSQ